jgi:uncharacterized damage-inducible protein DinB
MVTESDPPPAPDELVSTGSEREVLESFLDLYRSVMVREAAGLSDEQLRRRHVRSATTLPGLVRHLTAVERGWFQRRLGRYPDEQLDANTHRPRCC